MQNNWHNDDNYACIQGQTMTLNISDYLPARLYVRLLYAHKHTSSEFHYSPLLATGPNTIDGLAVGPGIAGRHHLKRFLSAGSCVGTFVTSKADHCC
jgi:hypothetical protein